MDYYVQEPALGAEELKVNKALFLHSRNKKIYK